MVMSRISSAPAAAQGTARQSLASGFAATLKRWCVAYVNRRAERINWWVEDLIGGDKSLDFSKPFLPENLARTASPDFVSSHEKHTLNQIRGHAYLCIFSLARAPEPAACRRSP
jgi:hypothetical protein